MTHRTEPNTSKRMIERARELRKEAPVPERLLWGMLRGRQLGGLKFRRQQPLGPYVADFYCERAGLVVELDGQSHIGQESQDAARDRYMRVRGLEVLRIANDELLRNREGVAETILHVAEGRQHALDTVAERPSSTPSHSNLDRPSPGPPQGEGERPSPNPSQREGR